MLSAICLNLDQSKILSSDNGLIAANYYNILFAHIISTHLASGLDLLPNNNKSL